MSIFLSIMLMLVLPQNVESTPISRDAYEKHRDYVDSIKSQQEKPPLKEQIKN